MRYGSAAEMMGARIGVLQKWLDLRDRKVNSGIKF
jgi:hypothetical protein